MSLWSRFMSGITAFREAFLSSSTERGRDFYSEWDARKMRYALQWAFYENTAYRNIHSWAAAYRQQQALYRYIRGIYNPTYRLGEFWKTHIWGGQLDPKAGDGLETPSAIPIVTENERLREPISQLWKWSNWGINKQIACLQGSILGDLGLRVVDDTVKNRVYLELIHPSVIKDLDLDRWGNVKGYVLEEAREHPYQKGQTVTYTETARREGASVVYQTLLNNAPFAWDGDSAEWGVDYGFVPFVMVQHNNVGLDWGWSEIHAGRSKFQEIDDLASKLSDQIRKNVDAVWLLTGVEKPRNAPRVTGSAPSEDANSPGKEEQAALYGPAGADAKALVAPLSIGETSNYIQTLIAELERDYPELQMDIWATGGDTSGRALRVARQRVETKVMERRPSYDDALVRAQAMAIAIGGFRGYKGFAGFDLDSYEKGELEHSIGDRDVFSKDALDDIEIEGEFWKAAEVAVKAGVPLLVFLKRNGWSDEDINEVVKSEEYKAKLAGLKMSQVMATGLDDDEQEGGGTKSLPNQKNNGGGQKNPLKPKLEE